MYGNIIDYLIEQGHTVEGWKYKVGEHNIYGSSRVGVHRTDLVMIKKHGQEDKEYTQEDLVNFAFIRGKRNYELSNHLGNVQVVITDKRIAVCNEELEVSRFEAEVLVATDYYPFGMIMPGRDWTYQECTEGFYDTTYGYDQLSFTFTVQTLTTGQDIELGYTLFPAIPLPVLTQYQSGHTLQEYIDEIVTNGSSVPGFTFTQTDIDEVTFTVDASGGFLDCGDTFIIHAPWQSIYFYATCSEQVKWVQDCKDVGYRYGFNGMEKDNEVKGSGNSIEYELRIYDSRLGKFLSSDPREREYPWQSTYAYFSNSPIKIIDFRGGGDEETETKSVQSDAQTETSKVPVPDNPVKALWWNFRLAITKTFTNRDCIKIKEIDAETGKKYSTTHCGKDAEGGPGGGAGGGSGGNSTTPGGGATSPGSVPLPGTAPTPPLPGGGTVLVNLNENAYPGATPGASTGTAVNITQNFAIPAPPAGFTGGTGTLWINYGTDIALLGTPTGTDNISNAISITPIGGTIPGAPILNTGQVWVGNVNAGPVTVTPGQQYNLTMNPNPAAVAAGTLTDRFFIVIRVTFP